MKPHPQGAAELSTSTQQALRGSGHRARGLPELENVRMLDNEPAEAAENRSAEAETPAQTEDAAPQAAPPTKRRATRRRASSSGDAPAASEAAPAASEAGGDDEKPDERVDAPMKRTRRRTKAVQPDADLVDRVATDDRDTDRPDLENAAAEAADIEEAEDLGNLADAEDVEPLDEDDTPQPRRMTAAPVLFMAPQPVAAEPRPARTRAAAPSPEPVAEPAEEQAETGRRRRRRRGTETAAVQAAEEAVEETEAAEDEHDDDQHDEHRKRRRGRRGRGRGKGTADETGEGEEATEEEAEPAEEPEEEAEGEEAAEGLTRRRRRRRRKGSGAEIDEADEDGVPTVVKIRDGRKAGGDEVQGVTGSTRLEAKRQRRRDGREQRRTRPPILTEAEFLARREAVDRVMVVRQRGDRTQIGVLEDGVLVEHYVTRSSAATMVGNVYLGRVQNVLPSMEAAFVDLGRGRNAVLYAGEVNWDAAGLEGRSRSIEQALKSGDSVLVQVTKDPIGHKGARLSSHIALSGRHLVYVPHGTASGISRKLSDVERRRLRDILKKLVPEGAGVIVRTAAEGASEEELERDVARLQAQWEEIQAKAASGGAPALLYSEPDLLVRVVRDLFNEDFKELIIAGDEAFDTVGAYLKHVSPDLVERVHRYAGANDVFATYRVDEQILKGLDRKVFLPSGGHLVIDRTEAMTVIDVNTGKYTGAGGNLEETVTRNNLEAAEEIVRQLRLRDLGGIVVIDFIDMVLESNRELVLRRLTECLGRDRTKHQVTEVTSLGLVQMTRKRIGAGLLEAFSEVCEHCKGRGVIVHTEPIAERPASTKNAGEKVKAVASGSHDQGAGRVDDDVEDGPAEPDDPFAAEAEVVEDTEALGDEDDQGEQERSGRRRGRRGGARRRTRP
jgi:ribonuclease E